MEISFQCSRRPETVADRPFLELLYASMREAELAAVAWSAEQKAEFCAAQFAAQHRYYREQYAGASFEIVLLDGEPAGRLYVARWAEEIRLIDIALLPERRGRGIGTALLRELLSEAAEKRLPLRSHVEKMNPALALYERLSFKAIEDRGVYWFLEARPGQPAAS